MIPKIIIDQIFETARIEEVIGEFVNLKKAGQNLRGLSPFVDEKTPSFFVSPVKQIFKCFSSGKGGSVVSFLMEHEHYSYPEALKFLAKRYQIEIPEEEQTDEQKQAANERESLYIVNSYGQDFFEEKLWNSDEGKSIGVSYFRGRGFTDDIIKKFKLGYNPSGWDILVKDANEKGYKTEFLIQAGLVKQKETRVYDTYRERVMFPIHNLSGRVIGFGGRTLKTDKKIPKYINSPESLIYHKSDSLYGIYYAKSAMIKHDMCYLVEGYTDVISLHQAGVENVVASSGTSLTEGQIRLIKRYTSNITVLYDGDAAGIKASFRGIDMILEQGLNIKVVLFPDGEDPDSYAQKLDSEDFKDYLAEYATDFIVFKSDVLNKDAKNDPLEKAKLLREVVNSIALIPDHLTRAVYIKECGRLLDVEEKVLILELNKIRRKRINDERSKNAVQSQQPDLEPLPEIELIGKQSVHVNEQDIDFQELDVIRLLLNYGNLHIKKKNDDVIKEEEPETIENLFAVRLIKEFLADQIPFENPLYQQVIETVMKQVQTDGALRTEAFLNDNSVEVVNLYVDVVNPRYALHKWDTVKIFVKGEEQKLSDAINSATTMLRLKRINKLIIENNNKTKIAQEEGSDYIQLQKELMVINNAKRKIADLIGAVILK